MRHIVYRFFQTLISAAIWSMASNTLLRRLLFSTDDHEALTKPFNRSGAMCLRQCFTSPEKLASLLSPFLKYGGTQFVPVGTWSNPALSSFSNAARRFAS